jgi:hypothetical protein
LQKKGRERTSFRSQPIGVVRWILRFASPFCSADFLYGEVEECSLSDICDHHRTNGFPGAPEITNSVSKILQSNAILFDRNWSDILLVTDAVERKKEGRKQVVPLATPRRIGSYSMYAWHSDFVSLLFRSIFRPTNHVDRYLFAARFSLAPTDLLAGHQLQSVRSMFC